MRILSRRVVIAAFVAATSSVAGAQTDTTKDLRDPRDAPTHPHDAQPERPTVATHAGTVWTGWIEFEAGFERDRGTASSSASIGTLVTKIGLAPTLQLSLFSSALSSSGGASGFGDFAIGIKWRLLEDHPILAKFAIQPSIKIPTGNSMNGAGTGTTDASLLFISSRDMGPFHLDLNVGVTLRDGSGVNAPRTASLWAASLSGPVVGDLQWTAELYGYPGTGGVQGSAPVVAVLAGPTYSLTNYAVFDLGTIIPVAGGQPRALFAGVTWNAGRIF